MKKKLFAFIARIRRGEVVKPLYLAYYYTYLSAYDWIHGTHFSNSQAPNEMGTRPSGGTGNFPAHPRLVRRFLTQARLRPDDALIDVGHGSGIVLHVASRMGFRNLSGVEYGQIPFDISVKNVGDVANLVRGSALDTDLRPFTAMTFFSPFRGEVAVEFFERVPSNVRTIVTINHDLVIEPVLLSKGYALAWSYQHRVYENFNAKLWTLAGPR